MSWIVNQIVSYGKFSKSRLQYAARASSTAGKEMTVRDALNSALDGEMAVDSRVFLMGEEVGEYRGGYKISKGLLEKCGPERVTDTRIIVAGFAGIGVGAAYKGSTLLLRPYYSSHPLPSYNLLLDSSSSLSSSPSRTFCSHHPSNLVNHSQAPAPIDYRCALQEDEFHKLADSTIHDLLEKLEEYGDSIDVDGFDIDYGNDVLTLKLGSLGTYVVNKQTPNRQIWLSSPVSGPSRFDWDSNAHAWIYRRNKANLSRVLESELEKLCGKPVNLA